VNDRIFVALSTFAEHDRRPLEMLERSRIPFALNRTGRRADRELLATLGKDATGIVAGVEVYDAAVLADLPRLRCISRCGVGTENIDAAAAAAHGVSVLNTPDAPTTAVAEHAVALILGALRAVPRHDAIVRAGEWRRVDTRLLYGKTVGLIGFGRIGRRVANILAAFEARILASDPSAEPVAARERGVELVPLGRLLDASDIVSLHAAPSPASPLRLGAAELGRMRRGAYLVNTARGDLVDDGALHEALRSGHLAGAALDVFSQEPYRGPLRDLPTVVLTPHAATYPIETRAAMELECVERLLRHLAAGQPSGPTSGRSTAG
jgi:D-3-phosphoglycerate dehydrogenase